MISGESLSILVLDDDVRFLESFRELLVLDGHCVYPATRGLEALDLVREIPLDLSFLDFDLPDLDGLETFARIHRQRPRLPAIFLTGNPSSTLERKVIDLGGYGLIRKPFDARRLRVVIREATTIKDLSKLQKESCDGETQDPSAQ
jgi:CheY-like chemotaxis protein